ncbi:hypothetical protein ACXWOQ_10050, partial [Streptococcus pyogenes]
CTQLLQPPDFSFDFVVTLSAKDETESKLALCSISILAKITGGMMLQLQFNNRVALSSCNRPTSVSTL